MIITALVIAIVISLANAQNSQACVAAAQDPIFSNCMTAIVSMQY